VKLRQWNNLSFSIPTRAREPSNVRCHPHHRRAGSPKASFCQIPGFPPYLHNPQCLPTFCQLRDDRFNQFFPVPHRISSFPPYLHIPQYLPPLSQLRVDRLTGFYQFASAGSPVWRIYTILQSLPP
jgi:hypothetical protein